MPGTNNAVRIFISYSSQDADIVGRLNTWLTQVGAKVWLDHERLDPGTPNWQLAVREGIAQATHVIYVASETAAISPYVIDEISLARGKGKPVIAFWARGQEWRDCAPLGWGVSQYADGREDKFEAGLGKLLNPLGLRANSTISTSAARKPQSVPSVQPHAQAQAQADGIRRASLLPPSPRAMSVGDFLTLLDEASAALRAELRDNDAKEALYRPSPAELGAIESLQRRGVTGIYLLDRMMEQGENWLLQTMRRLDYFEKAGLAPNDYSTWCEHALDGAFDYIDPNSANSPAHPARQPQQAGAPDWLTSRSRHQPRQDQPQLDDEEDDGKGRNIFRIFSN
jgi:hypothetical protein